MPPGLRRWKYCWGHQGILRVLPHQTKSNNRKGCYIIYNIYPYCLNEFVHLCSKYFCTFITKIPQLLPSCWFVWLIFPGLHLILHQSFLSRMLWHIWKNLLKTIANILSIYMYSLIKCNKQWNLEVPKSFACCLRLFFLIWTKRVYNWYFFWSSI